MIINNKVYFIHIPRTAGRFVHKSLELSNQKIKIFDFNFIFREKEAPHLTYPEYCLLTNYRSFKKFCIVRDPVDRFISMVRGTWKLDEEKISNMLSSQSCFDEAVSNLYLNNRTNWFAPQINFIDYKTKIWRFEDNFNNKFIDWLSHNFDINITNLANKLDFINQASNNITLNNKQIGYIKNYYYKDYKLLNY
tara:strand:- start:87 stop:665 length:579 start_codon:yes stop_codon:yes gene_type:complete